MRPLVRRIRGVTDFTSNQLLRVPRDPLAALAFGLRTLEQGGPGWDARFRDDVAPAMFTGVAAHANGRLPSLAAAGTGLTLTAHAHAGGWGLPIGGSQAIADALADEVRAHGGEVVTGVDVRTPADVGPSKLVLLDTSAEFLASYGRALLPDAYLRALRRYRRGYGVAKVDFALDGPIPWSSPELRSTPTVHLGGTRAEIAAAEHEVTQGRVPARPFVLVVQPTVADPTRAPAGKHIGWSYIHVPAGMDVDATEAITAQIERFAPGFRDLVLGSAAMTASDVQRHNPNYLGGDILGGQVSVLQLLRRPVLSPAPWRTPVRGLYLCSASTPPGPSTHGMNGWLAARCALRDVYNMPAPLGPRF